MNLQTVAWIQDLGIFKIVCGWCLWQGQSWDSLCLPCEVGRHPAFSFNLKNLGSYSMFYFNKKLKSAFSRPHMYPLTSGLLESAFLTTVLTDSDTLTQGPVIGALYTWQLQGPSWLWEARIWHHSELGYFIWPHLFSYLEFLFMMKFLGRICQEKISEPAKG